MYALHLVAINQTACTVVKTCFTESMLKPVSKTDIDYTTVYVYIMLKLCNIVHTNRCVYTFS